MKAAVRETFGSVEVREVEKPAPADNEVLVRVRASSVNAADWYTMMGRPKLFRMQMGGLRKPKSNRLGADFAGTVESVGKDVKEFAPGDDVFGARTGAYAEYVTVPVDRAIVGRPATVTVEEAAAVGVAGITALQGLRDKGALQPGQKVLINGASGGVGTFAVQIAKALGAHVAAVCSTRNVELARSLGAERVFDYTREDFTRSGEHYDVVFDNAGSRSWRELRRVLAPKAVVVLVGGEKRPWIGPLGHIVKLRLAAIASRRHAVFFVAKITKAEMTAMSELLETGKVKPVVEKTYALDRIADAFAHFGEGHAQGKIVVTV